MIKAFTNNLMRNGVCKPDPALGSCKIDQSNDGVNTCHALSACKGINQECSGHAFGVCQCKEGFCVDESSGDCVASGGALRGVVLAEAPKPKSGDVVTYLPKSDYENKYTIPFPPSGNGSVQPPHWQGAKTYGPPGQAFAAVFLAPILCLPCMLKCKAGNLRKLF